MTSADGRFLAAVLVLGAALGASPALAQEKLYKSLDAVPGKTVRLGMYANVSKECTPGPVPEIKVLSPPKSGAVAVKAGKTKAGAMSRCPTLAVPVQGIFYQANQKFTGSDEVAYEVRRPDNRVQLFTIKITVGEGAKSGGKPQDPSRDIPEL